MMFAELRKEVTPRRLRIKCYYNFNTFLEVYLVKSDKVNNLSGLDTKFTTETFRIVYNTLGNNNNYINFYPF